MFWAPGYRDDPTLPCRGTVCEPLESMRRECLYRGCSGPSVGHEPTCPSSLWGFTKLGCGGKQFCHCKTKGYFHYLFIIPCIYYTMYLSSHSIIQWLLKWSVSAKPASFKLIYHLQQLNLASFQGSLSTLVFERTCKWGCLNRYTRLLTHILMTDWGLWALFQSSPLMSSLEKLHQKDTSTSTKVALFAAHPICD